VHNTSHVDGEPYPTLLRDMGFGGFPSLAFLDAGGKKLASPPGRDVQTFETTLRALTEWSALSDKERRTAEEDAVLFVAELDLGMLSLDDARARRASLEGLTEAQAKHADNEILLLEVAAIQREAGRNAAQAAAAYATMAKEGRIPTGPRTARFWMGVLSHADESKDPELLELGIARFRAEFGDRPGADRMLQRYVDALAALKKDG